MMKKNVFLAVVMLAFTAAMVFSVVYLNNPSMFEKRKNETAEPKKEIGAITEVLSGEIKHIYETEGRVVYGRPDLYLDVESAVYSANDNVEIFVEKGEDVEKGQALFSVNGEAYLSGSTAKVISISREESDGETALAVLLLNYEKLVISAEVDVSVYQKINYSTPVQVTIDGEVYESSFSEIGYEISNGKIQVSIKAPCKCLPGTTASISLVTETIDNGCYIPVRFLEKSNGKYYVLRKNGDAYDRVTVVVGEFFSHEGWDYVEIKSGLTPSDIVAFEKYVSQSTNGGSSIAY